MSQTARHLRRAGKVVLKLYEDYDQPVAENARKLGVTCTKGCNHCCKLPASMTLPEAIPIADWLRGRTNWKARKSELVKQIRGQLPALKMADWFGPGRAEFYKRQLPCVFLRDGLCEVYPVRPAVCRYHMVVTDPENCKLGAADPAVLMVDLRTVENRVQLESTKAAGFLLGGPIPITLVWAFEYLGEPLLGLDHPALEPSRWIEGGPDRIAAVESFLKVRGRV